MRAQLPRERLRSFRGCPKRAQHNRLVIARECQLAFTFCKARQSRFTNHLKSRSIGSRATNKPRAVSGEVAMAAGGGIFGDMGDVCVAPFGRAAPRQARVWPRTHGRISVEQIVKAEIGPRLALFHHDRFAVPPPESRPALDDIERLAMLVIGTDGSQAPRPPARRRTAFRSSGNAGNNGDTKPGPTISR